MDVDQEGGLGTPGSDLILLGHQESPPDRAPEPPYYDDTYFEDQVDQHFFIHEDEDLDRVIDDFYGATSVHPLCLCLVLFN